MQATRALLRQRPRPRYWGGAKVTPPKGGKPIDNDGYNLYSILLGLRMYGQGAKVTKRSWRSDCYWQVTRVQYSLINDKFGEAWGIKYWNGVPLWDGREQQIGGTLRKRWRLLENVQSAQTLKTHPTQMFWSGVGANPRLKA